MLSDAALSIVVGDDAKWLYNSARRLKRPILRSSDQAEWWRLVHHLSVGLGAPLNDAARAADTLLAPGMHPGRVRLRATGDESVSIVVDLARFHDGAALALAAAQVIAIPKQRGRPRSSTRGHAIRRFSPTELDSVVRARARSASERFATAVGELGSGGAGAADLLRRLSEAGVPFTVVGDVAAGFHGGPWQADAIDICADLTTRYGQTLCTLLNGLNAQPRGTPVRDGFRLDPALIRSAPMLALRVEDMHLNIQRSLDGIGEYSQVESRTELVDFDGRSIRVLSMDALVQAGLAGLAAAGKNSRWSRWVQLGSLLAPDSGTR